MSDLNRLRKRPTPRPQARTDAVYARTAAVYADARRSGLDPDRPALRRLLADVPRGGLRRVVVRDLSRLARNATLLQTILDEFRTAGVELVTIGEGNRDA